MSVILFLTVLTEFADAVGSLAGASRRYDGPMGKSDRALVFGALALWGGLGAPLPDWSAWIMVAVAGLLAATTVNRVRAGLKEAAGEL